MFVFEFSEPARTVLELSQRESRRRGHEYVGTEHMLLALVAEGGTVAADVLADLKLDTKGMVDFIDAILKRGQGQPPAEERLPYTSRATKVVELAKAEADRMGDNRRVGTEHLLLGILLEQKGIGAQTLAHFGATIENARAATQRVLGRT